MFISKVVLYSLLLLIINILATFCLGIVFLQSPALHDEAINQITGRQTIFNFTMYGIAVSTFFTLLTAGVSLLFRAGLNISKRTVGKISLLQLLFLLVGYFGCWFYLHLS